MQGEREGATWCSTPCWQDLVVGRHEASLLAFRARGRMNVAFGHGSRQSADVVL
jgi:hypothetical protein